MKIRKTIREWEIEKGIRINKPTGFGSMLRKHKDVYANTYTEEQFKRGAEKSYITVKTLKGLEFMNS